MKFRNTDGVALKGVLFKPANFDPKKKYPLMVYIYERLSQGVHNFVNPGPERRSTWLTMCRTAMSCWNRTLFTRKAIRGSRL